MTSHRPATPRSTTLPPRRPNVPPTHPASTRQCKVLLVVVTAALIDDSSCMREIFNGFKSQNGIKVLPILFNSYDIPWHPLDQWTNVSTDNAHDLAMVGIVRKVRVRDPTKPSIPPAHHPTPTIPTLACHQLTTPPHPPTTTHHHPTIPTTLSLFIYFSSASRRPWS